MWFRRDLRIEDLHALAAAVAAAGDGGVMVPLFVIDPALWDRAGANRRWFLRGALAALNEALTERGSRLILRYGDPIEVVPAVAAEIGAATVFHSQDVGVYGRRRDEDVATALTDDGRALVEADSPWVVPAGTVHTKTGDGFKVYSAYLRVWRQQRLARRVDPPERLPSPGDLGSDPLPDEVAVTAALPEPTPTAARARFESFLADAASDYDDGRDRPDLDGTSRLSPYLRFGLVHPRQLIRGLDPRNADHDRFLTELAWRDFYADVLHHAPSSAWENWSPTLAGMAFDAGPAADERFAAWCDGRTGFPIVDAGMRQLLAEGWMHNRVRMIVASFLVKDLHLPWQRGARWFMTQLVDGDLPSNQHGWQWVAGTGTDAAPYFRVFNPTTQGEKFDPAGDYVRRYVPELRTIGGRTVHQPDKAPGGRPTDYPAPIVDHPTERLEALARYQQARA
jgi:deoxyribodipyrimidine photo-lyase